MLQIYFTVKYLHLLNEMSLFKTVQLSAFVDSKTTPDHLTGPRPVVPVGCTLVVCPQ